MSGWQEYEEEVESAQLEMWLKDKKEPDDGAICLSCTGVCTLTLKMMKAHGWVFKHQANQVCFRKIHPDIHLDAIWRGNESSDQRDSLGNCYSGLGER